MATDKQMLNVSLWLFIADERWPPEVHSRYHDLVHSRYDDSVMLFAQNLNTVRIEHAPGNISVILAHLDRS